MAKYEAPTFRRATGIDFVLHVLRAAAHKVACRQCSSCHGCR